MAKPLLARAVLSSLALALIASTPSVAAAGGSSKECARPRDGQHDFDFMFGRWAIKLRRLKNPLTGSREWIELTGTSHGVPIWGGKAQMDEFVVNGPDGPVTGLTVRLYSPTSRQWSIYWANQKNPDFGIPTVGEFRNGRGEFYDQEMYKGRSIWVRYVWSNITKTSAHFEQAFSADCGKTWEVNWISDQTRAE